MKNLQKCVKKRCSDESDIEFACNGKLTCWKYTVMIQFIKWKDRESK